MDGIECLNAATVGQEKIEQNDINGIAVKPVSRVVQATPPFDVEWAIA